MCFDHYKGHPKQSFTNLIPTTVNTVFLIQLSDVYGGVICHLKPIFILLTNIHVGEYESYYLCLISCSLDLTWRDVQYVIVATANPDPLLSSENFTTNGAGRKCKRHVMFPYHVPQTTR